MAVAATPDPCRLDPASLPRASTTLGDDMVFNRGIDVHPGGEPMSLRVTRILENVRNRNARDCGFGNASIRAGCQETSGSSFEIENSPTWATSRQGTWKVTAVDAHNGVETVIDGSDGYGCTTLPFKGDIWVSCGGLKQCRF